MKQLFFSILVFVIFFFVGNVFSPILINKLIPEAQFQLTPNIGYFYGNINDYFGSNLILKMETFKIVDEMTDSQKAGMLLMPAFESNHSYLDLEEWVSEYNIGGFMVLHGQITKDQIEKIKTKSSETLGLPLFVSLDAEPSLVRNRISELSEVLETSEIKTANDSIDQANLISNYLYKNGYNLNFAPVYDNDQNKSVISSRSFGGGTGNIALLAGLFSQTSKDKNILTTAKHFPGHGSVSGDTHLSLQVIKDNLTELDNFKSAIDQNIPFMMVGHLAINSQDQKIDTEGLPSTLSKKIMTDLLQKDLRFDGVVITDAMNMGALNQFKNINIEALNAGADILLMPRNLTQAHSEILEEMNKSQEFRKLIDQKVRKIVRMKLALKWAR